MASLKKGGLGRGLGALIPQQIAPSSPEPVAPVDSTPDYDRLLHLDPRELDPNPLQPRVVFNEEALEELAESIKRDGVQEPVLVRKVGDRYQLVSGERRVRASIMADAGTVPAICREVSDTEMLRLGLIENIQREDLNAIEEARAYKRLMETFSWTQEELSGQVGKKRATIANLVRLLNLPEDVQNAVATDAISMGHARALLAVGSASLQLGLCKRIIAEGLSVRQIEQIAAAPKKPTTSKAEPPKDPNITALEDELRRRLGTKVHLRPSSPSRGKLEIEYFNLDDLDRILDIIRR